MLSHGGEQQECSADHHHTAPNRNYYGGTYSGREGDDARRSWSQCVGLGRDLCLAVEKLSAAIATELAATATRKGRERVVEDELAVVVVVTKRVSVSEGSRSRSVGQVVSNTRAAVQ